MAKHSITRVYGEPPPLPGARHVVSETELIEHDSAANVALGRAIDVVSVGVSVLAHVLVWGLRFTAALALYALARTAQGVLMLEKHAGGGPKQLPKALMPGNEDRRLLP